MDSKVLTVRADLWREVIRDCNNRPASMTKKEWCFAKGINTRSLCYWQKKFRDEAISQATTFAPGGLNFGPEENCFVDITEKVNVASSSTCPVAVSPTTKALDVASAPEHVHEPKPFSGPASSGPEIMVEYGSFKVFLCDEFSKTALKNVIEVLADVQKR